MQSKSEMINGLWVAVLGPDGAGKSTLVEGLERELRGIFRRTLNFHFMLELLRKQGSGGPVIDPHAKPPHSWFISLLKLGYYWLNYNLGYWLKIHPALVHSTLVLFDRYYHDLLVDPKRYRYGAPLWLARIVGRFIPKPHLWFILDVPEEKILHRKQEVSLEEICRQQEAYRRLASELSGAFLLDGSLSPEEVTRQARDVILDFLHERYIACRHVWFLNARQENNVKWLKEVLGVKENSQSQEARYLYLSLPDGRGYLLPQNSRRAAVAGLSLYSAQKPRARMGKILLNLGLRSKLASQMLPKITVNLESLQGFLRKVFGRKDLALSVSLGTPGPHRKPVVQVMTSKGGILGYVKVGWNKPTQALIQNEVEVLKKLKSYNSLPFLIPQVLFTGEWQGKILCIQSPPPARARYASFKIDSQYVKVMKALARMRIRYYSLEDSPFWKQIEERKQKIHSTFLKYLLEQTMKKTANYWKNRKVPFHLAHGDFTPWNALQVNGILYLYDWEYALDEAPAGYDLFHFLVQVTWLVKKKAPNVITKSILKFCENKVLQTYVKLYTSTWKDLKSLFSLYLLNQVVSSYLEENSIKKILLHLLLLTQFQIIN